MADVLPSWNNTPTKQAILDFVATITDETNPNYVPPSERIATFDNDGTLWCEQPIPVQGFFLYDRIRQLAEQQPELRAQQPYKAVIESDWQTFATFGKKELLMLFFATHCDITLEAFQAIAKSWLNSATHPRFGRLYLQCVYQPMLELMAYLRANQFKNFIVSGGGIEFIRAFAEAIYSIPPEQVIGSSAQLHLEIQESKPLLVKQPELKSFDDREQKVVNIALHIGRIPILAVGNSDGDLAMLQYTMAGTGARLALLLHHDDAEREYAYDRNFTLSPLRDGLEKVPKMGGRIISMKQDFAQIFSD